MPDEFQTLYVTQYSAIRRALILATIAAYLVLVVSDWRTLSPMDITATAGTLAFMAWVWASVFVRRTRITEQGVEYRTSVGTKRFGRWPDIVVLERRGKSLAIQFGSTEVKLTKAEADLNRLSDLLKNRAARYGYDI